MTRPTAYPENLAKNSTMALDDFLNNRPHQAWMYLIHLKTQPGRFLRDLSKKQYFVRKDGLIAIYDTETGGKGAWDFYDPKEGAWFANKDLPEPASVWGQGSPGIYQKRGRKPGWRKTDQKNAPRVKAVPKQEVEAEIVAQSAVEKIAAPKKRRGRPPGSKNKPKVAPQVAQQVEAQIH